MKKHSHDLKHKPNETSAWLELLVRQNDEIIELLEQISKQISEISTTKIVFDQPPANTPETAPNTFPQTTPPPQPLPSPWYVDPTQPQTTPTDPWLNTPWATTKPCLTALMCTESQTKR